MLLSKNTFFEDLFLTRNLDKNKIGFFFIYRTFKNHLNSRHFFQALINSLIQSFKTSSTIKKA